MDVVNHFKYFVFTKKFDPRVRNITYYVYIIAFIRFEII